MTISTIITTKEEAMTIEANHHPRDQYEPLTTEEIEWFNAIVTEHPKLPEVRVEIELVKRGLSPDRAGAIVDIANLYDGRPTPSTRLGMFVAQHSTMPIRHLWRLAQMFVPDASLDDLIAEVERRTAAGEPDEPLPF